MFQKFTIDDLTIKLPSVKKIKLKFLPKIVKDVPKPEVKYGYDKKLEKIKNEIENMKADIWDKYKLFVNPFILINLSGIERKHMYSLTNYDVKKICQIETISRAFYKLWEIVVFFNLLSNQKKCIVSANLAEGPGGFMQSIIHYRKKYFGEQYKCNKLVGITLKKGESEHVEFLSRNPRVMEFISQYKNKEKIIEISYGNGNNSDAAKGAAKGNGDLNKLNNIKGYAKLFDKGKADLVTADGGFPSEYAKNIQEQVSNHLIFNEIVTALSVQKEGGDFVCKTFSLVTKLSIQLLYLLAIYYDEVYITKPVTSRITNNEHYIVNRGFRGIEKKELKELYKITEKWYEIDERGGVVMPENFIESIYTNKISNEFVKMIKEYNEKINKIQFENINVVLRLIKNGDKGELMKRIKEQEIVAQKWCEEYFR